MNGNTTDLYIHLWEIPWNIILKNDKINDKQRMLMFKFVNSLEFFRHDLCFIVVEYSLVIVLT